MSDERWFTVRQIAGLLQADEQTIRRWLNAGRITGRNFGGKVGWRVRESDLNAFLLDGDSKRAA
jgi:excisionase family DNA binding protein